jgi:hypothetical protein
VRFIAVSRTAADEIIADRRLQSVEYETGRAFAKVLQNPDLDARLSPRITLSRYPDGLFLLSAARSPDYVVFDLQTCSLFDEAHSLAEVLLYIQKVLRFAKKIWGNLKLSITERTLPGSSKAIVFPNPISQHTSFRISIELSPDPTRQAKRSGEGRSLLVYRCGLDEGGGKREEASLTNFRRFLTARRALAEGQAVEVRGAEPQIAALHITSIDGSLPNQVNPFQGYDGWMAFLTDRQKSFVCAELLAPHRIEGPAGTGKTMCLILKAITGLRAAFQRGDEHRALFVTHSEATRRSIEQIVEANDPSRFSDESKLQSLKLTTLQQLCGELLERDISETEFLDRDAMESKVLQFWYVTEAFNTTMAEDYHTHQSFLSAEFDEFLQTTKVAAIAEMLQHEISVVIKGRAEEQLENYRKLPRLKYGLPVQSPADRGFVWIVFRKYQSQLQAAAQFDTDDIVLTTIGQLNTPIWRRRRARDGYDSIYIDETHLFNINELSLFHYLSKNTIRYPIAYSVDRSQATGDRGWTDDLFEETLSPGVGSTTHSARTEVRGIFRCSPDIVNLAFSVTSAGATLFTNFDDPLRLASSMFTPEEERKCSAPRLVACTSDDDMVAEAFARAEHLTKELSASRCDVALVAFTDDLFRAAATYSVDHNKPTELLKQRGDSDAVRRAKQSGRFVLSTPEYIGGLEFEGVILIGVDDGRVPPSKTLESADSANYLSYVSHNRLYVAITRARYRVEVLIANERGPSPLLQSAIASGAFQNEDDASEG